jgi:hypothetical protein
MHIVCEWLRETPLEASVCWTWQTVPFLTISSTSYLVRNSRSWSHSLAWWIQSAHVCVLKIYVNVFLETTCMTPKLSLQLIPDRQNFVWFFWFSSTLPLRSLTRMTRTGNRLSYFGMESDYCRLRFCFVVLRSSRSLWARGVRLQTAVSLLMGLRVRIPLWAWMSDLVSVVCCQVEVSTSSWSRIQSVLMSVVCLNWVWSCNLDNEGAPDH